MAASITSEIQLLAPSACIELYDIDMTPTTPGINMYYFHNGTNKLSGPVVWQGNTYQPWPIQVTGFAKSTTGSMPRIRVTLSNVTSFWSNLALNFSDLLGIKLSRHKTFARFLDAVNFPGSVNADADPTQEFPLDVFYMEQKMSENNQQVVLDFAAQIDVEGVMLPRRQVTQNGCPWLYRGADCGYTGVPVADDFDNLIPTSPAFSPSAEPFSAWNNTTAYAPGDVVYYLDPTVVSVCGIANSGITPDTPSYWLQDICGKTLNSCRLRFGENGILPFGGFPGVSLVPTSV